MKWKHPMHRRRTFCLALCIASLVAIFVVSVTVQKQNAIRLANIELIQKSTDKNRILCYTLTGRGLDEWNQPWAKKCDIHLLVNYKDVATLPLVDLPLLDKWNGSASLLAYIWANYKDQVDWIVKADNESFVLVDQLSDFLGSFNHSAALWFNWQLKRNGGKWSSGFVLSRETLARLVQVTTGDCPGVTEGKLKDCLSDLGAKLIDVERERFVPFDLDSLPKSDRKSAVKCCPEWPFVFYGVKANQMNLIHYFTTKVKDPAESTMSWPTTPADCRPTKRPLIRAGVPELVEKRIFFLETSGRPSLKLRAACAVESAAKANPNRPIQVLIFNASVDESSPSMQVLAHYPNVQVYGMTFEEFFNNTPFQTWFQEGQWRQSPYSVSHLSDFIRMLALWKGGGIYMDTDFVVLRSLDGLDNFSCNESPDATSSGVIGVDVGHRLMDILIRDLPKSYKPMNWGNNGPAALQRALKVLCNVSRVDLMTPDTCGGYRLLPAKYFYPIHYNKWSQYFEESAPEALSKFNESYALHFWNKLSSNATVRVGSRQLYALAAAKHCPHVFATAATVF